MSWKQSRQLVEPQPYIRMYTTAKPRNETPRNEIPSRKLRNCDATIEFPITNKPTHQSNSKVSRIPYEQQSDQHNNDGEALKKEVIWPPPEEETDGLEQSQENQTIFNSQFPQNHQIPQNGFQHKKPPKHFEPPPTYIHLRQSAPMSQDTAPVYKAQPATDKLKGGVRMRGDEKWPPSEYKAQAELDNEASGIQHMRGPFFRPLKEKKDYTKYFAENALPSSYPGYKAPPGTQHFSEFNGSYVN